MAQISTYFSVISASICEICAFADNIGVHTLPHQGFLKYVVPLTPTLIIVQAKKR